ncbi:response regulator [Methanobrevibacter sp.]|uniref:response regulator n=1 Tax=Methanobrevibacter sp. TaxID=66852 RepID=UPI00388FF8D0
MSVNILIVEDEAITAMDLKYSLQDLGYDVVGTVDTGQDAIDASNELKPDVVLMDIKLKGDMEGTEAAQSISKLGSHVIFVSANTDMSTIEELNIEGTLAFVSKPFDINQLDKTIQNVVKD